jgi:hypothetical protein
MHSPLSSFLRNPRRAAARLRSILDARLTGPLLSRSRIGNVVLFHIGRSGSTVLGDLLDQHPRVFWDQEIYRGLEDKAPRLTEGHNPELSGKALQILRQRMNRVGKEFYGFETKFFQLRLTEAKLPDYIEGLKHIGITHFIVLERENYLRKVVSSLVYHAKNASHQRPNKQVQLNTLCLDVNNLCIDKDAKPLLAYLNQWKQDFNTLKRLLAKENVLYLSYEADILPNPIISYERTCAFLGIALQRVSVHYGRTNPFRLSEIITNFPEVKEYLSATPFEWMLNGD